MTPIRRQYLSIKRRYPDAVVLFRLGDFYETFDEDARTAARELDIVLTSRNMGKGVRVPMAGIPAHALETYLGRLIKRGHRVAVCEQLSDPAASQGLVERDVVRVVTPGTVIEPSLLDQGANNYLASVNMEGEEAGLAYADITTGEFRAAQLPVALLAPELARLSPAEVLIAQGQELPEGAGEWRQTQVPSSFSSPDAAARLLMEHFGVANLESTGCAAQPLALASAGAIVEYLDENQRAALEHLDSLSAYSISEHMTLDPQTRRNLELFEAGRWGGTGGSLFATLDLTRTSMGKRLLKRWLGQPLLDVGRLSARQEAVTYFFSDLAVRQSVISALSQVSDIERLINRVRLGVASPRELTTLKGSLQAASRLGNALGVGPSGAPPWLVEELRPCDEVVALLDAALTPDSTGTPGEGDVIREGFSPELDELRRSSSTAREYIAGLERAERERTGIKNLKVGYNRVFGYYIEVSKSGLSQVPDHYARRQTLVGGERFMTPELKEYESLILSARERVDELERTLLKGVCGQVTSAAADIIRLAGGVAHADVLSTLAEAAARFGYVPPLLTEGNTLDIKGGRHPVVEQTLPAGRFVPNDTYLSNDDTRVVVLTGPNMAGKSTYIRQVALIVLMAQTGSYVPAESATVGLVDRIFTRVGLQDDLATGQSTFMVEMVETASILNQATPRSLVVLDEIGRGTSTYDGLSIARSVVEYVHNSPRLGCKTLFATHYHELTQLASVLPGVRNHNVAVAEEDGEVVFLHRIVPGGADKSYGVHVARLAGLPRAVINRAWEVLEGLESNGAGTAPTRGRRRGEAARQLSLPLPTSPVLDELMELDTASMTPLEAINKLYELQLRARESATTDDPLGKSTK